MTSTNQLLGRDAAPYVLEHEGRRYEFRALSQVEKSAFRAWMIGRAREILCAIYEGEARGEALAGLTRDALAGKYDFFGEEYQHAVSTPEGAVNLAAVLAGCSAEEMLALFAARSAEVKHLLGLVVAESMRRHGLKAQTNGQEAQEDKERQPDGSGVDRGHNDPFAASGYRRPP
jgi:hypothetical protein